MIKTPLSTVIGGAFWTPGATVINGAKISFEIVMKKLFANGEQGFWYDPSDMGTMFQDAAGTVPVTAVGQPLGLVLDKKNPALVGGEVDVDITNWASPGGITKVDKKTFSNTTHSTGLFYDEAAVDGLKVVELHYTVTGGTVQICDALGARVRAESTQPSGILKAVFFPDRSSSPLGRIYFRLPAAGTTLVINKLIVHTYIGNHAYQTTSAARPILQNTPRRIDFDAIDDKLITNLPAQLTGCTVIRSVPGVGAQILTGQTIPTLYNDNTDHCGLIVINRALTPSETSAITAEFNKRAGV